MSARDDTLASESTRQPGPMSFRAARGPLPALTIACHPDPTRVGDRALLSACASGGIVALSRLEPDFTSGLGERAPLADPFISRKAALSFHGNGGGLLLRRDSADVSMRLDGEPLGSAAELSAEQLERGAVLELADRHVLVLHATSEWSDPPAHGLVGGSDAIVRLRRAIEQLAPLDVKVLVRGETGTGKELVANALHRASRRAGGPCVVVNMAAVQPNLAASTLFGHVKGAFSGATSDLDGRFRDADGGTLFLDEIGETPSDVQPMLLRTLETGEVQPLGSAKTVHVDARVIAATDADLETLAGAGDFREPLLHRLAESVVRIAPLRERRDDIARLLLHFLRADLADMGASDRLTADSLERPWLSAPVVARLVRHDWPGNVRQLRNVARQLAIACREDHRLRLNPTVEAELARTSPRSEAPAAPTPARPAPADSEAGPRRLDEISEDELVAALAAHGYKRDAAAKALGISRTSIYELIARSSRIKKATDLGRDDIERARDACGGNLREAAAQLGVSERGLKLRMRELGL